MKFTTRYLILPFVFAAGACTTAYGLSHPNFQAASDSINNAINRIKLAQQVNGPTFGGHAARAIELLEQAKTEVDISDEYHRGLRR